MSAPIRFIRSSTLEIAYEEDGERDGVPVLLLHGWPYDPRCYDTVVPLLAAAHHRVIVPYLRGFGLTRFLSAETMRSGQQAALGQDLLDLMDGLRIESALLAGFDWGGRAACIVAALWPARVRGLVTGNGYNIQDIAAAVKPQPPEQEYRLWYQYYFHGERGRAGLEEDRRAFCRFIWQLWSPHWSFDDATFERSATSFDNAEFVALTIHSYRHRFGYAPGDPAIEPIERRLATRPLITVPTVVLHGADSGIQPAQASEGHRHYFPGLYERRVLPMVGHNLPQEAPQAFADAVLALRGHAKAAADGR